MTTLDAYALVAYLRAEEAGGEVATLLRDECVMASVNALEVVDQLVRVFGKDPDDVEADLAILVHGGLWIMTVDEDWGVAAGRLRARCYHREECAVSLADCVAAVTSLRTGRALATSDPPLASLVRGEGGKVIALPDSQGRRP